MDMTETEIIDLLGGITSVARILGIKPPSVFGWLETGIPQGRLRDLAPLIERKSNGRFTRRAQWPDMYAFYWPELADFPGQHARGFDTPEDQARPATASEVQGA